MGALAGFERPLRSLLRSWPPVSGHKGAVGAGPEATVRGCAPTLDAMGALSPALISQP